MSKKYQVFVSSTYLDMRDERQAAVEAILMAGHIPAGMELFSAGDKSQLEVIKRWIEESDVFMLVLGARYGSIEPTSGLSYIELEYDHAVRSNKPLFALVMSDKSCLAKVAAGLANGEEMNSTQYSKFRSRVLEKISRQVDDYKDIKLFTLDSLRNLATEDRIVGWMRGNNVYDVKPLISQIEQLNRERNLLLAEVKTLQQKLPNDSIDDLPLAGLDDEVQLEFHWYVPSEGRHSSSHTARSTFTHKWSEIFGVIAPELLSMPNDNSVKTFVANELLKRHKVRSSVQGIEDTSYQTIKIQLKALGLIDLAYSKTVSGGMGLFWSLTAAGERQMMLLRTQKKPMAEETGASPSLSHPRC